MHNIICSNAPYAIQSGMEAFQNLSEIHENQRHSYLKAQLDKSPEIRRRKRRHSSLLKKNELQSGKESKTNNSKTSNEPA